MIYFYPKDDTPGCTKEACDFRDNLKAFNSAKVRVLGVSPDDPKRHAKFKEKYGLNFTLLSDVDKTLIGAYGIWIKKLNYGREYMGVQRSTFIVDKTGKIAKAWNGVRVPGTSKPCWPRSSSSALARSALATIRPRSARTRERSATRPEADNSRRASCPASVSSSNPAAR